MSPFQTHQPLLFACAQLATGGEIIELGSGLHSTPQLAAMYRARFTSYETDQEWATKLGRLVKFVKSYDDVRPRPCAMIFIDNAPEERRGLDVARWSDAARLIVVHDSDPQYTALFGLDESLALFPYRLDYTAMSPNTTVVSKDWNAIRAIGEVFKREDRE
jgi:hypothetical protein